MTLALNPYAAADAGLAAVVRGGRRAAGARAAAARAAARPARAGAARRGDRDHGRRDGRDRAAARRPLRPVSLVSLPANLIVAPGRRADHVARDARGAGRAGRPGAGARRSPPSTAPLVALRRPRRRARRRGSRTRVARRAAARAARRRWPATRRSRAWLAAAPRPGARGGRSRAAVARRRRSRGAAAAVPPPAAGRDPRLLPRRRPGRRDADRARRPLVLFDTGPPGGPIVAACARSASSRLDALVITHAQADHEGAAIPVIDRFRPRLIVNGGAGWPTPVQRALPARPRRRRVAAVPGTARLGAAASSRCCGRPQAVARAAADRRPQRPRRSSPTCAAAASTCSWPPTRSPTSPAPSTSEPVEALKVAHHGSDDPGLARPARGRSAAGGRDRGRPRTTPTATRRRRRSPRSRPSRTSTAPTATAPSSSASPPRACASPRLGHD